MRAGVGGCAFLFRDRVGIVGCPVVHHHHHHHRRHQINPSISKKPVGSTLKCCKTCAHCTCMKSHNQKLYKTIISHCIHVIVFPCLYIYYSLLPYLKKIKLIEAKHINSVV